jgi:ArsR family metal-binding transcriptional regulator
MSYLASIALTKILPCLAEPAKVIVIGKPDRSLDEVLPYMATLPGVIAYNPEICTLTLRRRPGFITLFADQVKITQVKDAQEGLALLAALEEAINTVWDQRSNLVAMTMGKRAPRHLDIWELLPRTNCGQCGETTCLAFAVGLLQQKHNLSECLPLIADAASEERRSSLEAML